MFLAGILSFGRVAGRLRESTPFVIPLQIKLIPKSLIVFVSYVLLKDLLHRATASFMPPMHFLASVLNPQGNQPRTRANGESPGKFCRDLLSRQYF